MSNLLPDIVKKLKFLKGWNVEQVAESIGYSRIHLQKQMGVNQDKDVAEGLYNKLIEKHKSILNVSKKDDTIQNVVSEASPEYNELMQVPVLEISAQAGYARGGFADLEYIENLPKVFITKEYEKGNYCVFVIKGDSMDNGTNKGICENDRVLAKELPKMYWKSKLHFNQYLFIIVYKGGCLCKEITAHNINTGEIKLHSWNTMYEDIKINLSDVSQLFYIKKIVERSIKM